MRIGVTLTSSLDVDQKFIDLTDQVASNIAAHGFGIVYGGTAYGMMNQLAESYKKADGEDLCGVMARDLMAATKNYKKFSQLDEEYIVETVEDRKRKIISLSDAFIILPGGYGTLDEIGSIIAGKANKLYSKPIAFHNLDGYYNALFAFMEELHSQKFTRINPEEIYFSSENIDEIISFFEGYSKKELQDKFVLPLSSTV